MSLKIWAHRGGAELSNPTRYLGEREVARNPLPTKADLDAPRKEALSELPVLDKNSEDRLLFMVIASLKTHLTRPGESFMFSPVTAVNEVRAFSEPVSSKS